MLRFLLVGLATATLQNAQTAFDQQDYPAAARHYQEYLQEMPQDYEALLGYARSLAFAGEHAQALEAYSQLLLLFPNDADGLLGRARVLGWLKRYDEASRDLQQLLRDKPDYVDAWQALADIYFWSENRPAAEAHFQAWQSAYPAAPEPWLAQVRTQIADRQFVAARASLSEARARGGEPATLDRLLTQINRVPGAQAWEALVQYDFQPFLGGTQPPWHTVTGGLRYTHDSGSIALQGLTATRFDLWDQAVVAEAWQDLWPGAYGNLRLLGTVGPEVLPSWDVFGELFQSFADTWELSGSYRLMQFNSGGVHFAQLGVGKYLGNWYLRAQPMAFFANEGPGASLTLWARYFLDSADNYVELRTGVGRRIVTLDAGPRIQGQTNAFGILSSQYFFTPQFGLIGALSYNYDEAFPAQLGFSLGSKLRW